MKGLGSVDQVSVGTPPPGASQLPWWAWLCAGGGIALMILKAIDSDDDDWRDDLRDEDEEGPEDDEAEADQ